MLPEHIKQKILTVAKDRMVQQTVLYAMFHDSERGTYLWEYLKDLKDNEYMDLNTLTILFGECDGGFDLAAKGEGLYGSPGPNEVIDALLDAVENEIEKKL